MKKFLLSCAFGGFALFANAAYLQWQVDTDYNGGDWNYVSVYLVNSTDSSRTLLTNYSTTDGSEVGNTIDKATALSDETYIINVGEADSYSFYVEYYKWSTTLPESHASLSDAVVGVGEFEATPDNTYDTTSLSLDLPGSSAAWPTPVSYTASVPEPTSGLLMLFGAAMLGLKRKNRSRA